jgi:hypothetical protein
MSTTISAVGLQTPGIVTTALGALRMCSKPRAHGFASLRPAIDAAATNQARGALLPSSTGGIKAVRFSKMRLKRSANRMSGAPSMTP